MDFINKTNGAEACVGNFLFFTFNLTESSNVLQYNLIFFEQTADSSHETIIAKDCAWNYVQVLQAARRLARNHAQTQWGHGPAPRNRVNAVPHLHLHVYAHTHTHTQSAF